MLSGPAVAPVRSTVSVSMVATMDEVAAKAAWLAKQETPSWGGAESASLYAPATAAAAPAMTGMIVPTKKAPKSGWTLTLAGGTRTIADVRAARKKAEKSYVQKDEVECDITRYEGGWTTK